MSWLNSMVAAVGSGAVGLLLAGFLANACVSWYHVSSREGGSGFFVMFLGVAGGVLGFILGLVASRLVVGYSGPGLGKELAAALGVVVVIAGLAAVFCRLLADVPPEIDGQELTLEVEFRFPNTFHGTNPPTAQGEWLYTFASLSGHTCRKRDYGNVHTNSARFEGGQWIVPTTVGLFTERGKRSVSLAPKDAQEAFGFLLPLPRRPGREFLAWSAWIPRQQMNGEPWPADKMSCRFRLQKIPLPAPMPTHEELMSEQAARAEEAFLAIPADSPIQAWFPYLAYEQSHTQRALQLISSRSNLVAELAELVVSPDAELAHAALKCVGMLPSPPQELIPAVQAAGREIAVRITKFNNTSAQDDPNFEHAVDPATRFYGWIPAVESLRQRCGADFVPELKTILELSCVRPESHCMRVDIGTLGSRSLQAWSVTAPASVGPDPEP
ncbi:MAG: GlsB/YeaQ/YmgE family stress response membrane protein [Verrucomicrobiales bacterium]|nr:GlsB/YeaQ/YmgE family stress response membrane protein [Verrucomicrobiales bacterium]